MSTLCPLALSALPVGGAHAVAYALFVLLIVAFLALDLGVFHRKAHAVGTKEALGWTGVWVAVAMLFNVGVYFLYTHHVLGLGLDVPVLGRPGATETLDGWTAAKQFFAGYIVEKSLSMDNIFVIAVIFASLGIPAAYQHRVLFWGIVGALVMRGAMVGLGSELVHRFSWTVYVFGGFLILTAIKMALVRGDHTDPAASPVVRLVKRVLPVTPSFHGQRFVVRIGGRRFATPLLLALLLVEFTDIVFAVDSIPAIFAITADPFIVFTSNIMALLGLRSLYFCLAVLMKNFRFLKPALVLVLMFVGVKMMLVHSEWKVSTAESLYGIVGILGAGVVASLLWPPKKIDLPMGPAHAGRGPKETAEHGG